MGEEDSLKCILSILIYFPKFTLKPICVCTIPLRIVIEVPELFLGMSVTYLEHIISYSGLRTLLISPQMLSELTLVPKLYENEELLDDR